MATLPSPRLREIDYEPPPSGEATIFYTDGSYRRKLNEGTWAWAILMSKEADEIGPLYDIFAEGYGRIESTTNNRMELTAILMALAFASRKRMTSVIVYSDSRYAQEMIQKYADLPYDHLRSTKNMDLIRQIVSLMKSVTVAFEWVKGHNGDERNEYVDELCGGAYEAFITP